MDHTRTSEYDAFISYSHGANNHLASGIEQGLRLLTKRWNQRRALRVFLDQSNLGASSDVWGTLTEALDRARFLILLASPQAALSQGVDREIKHWIDTGRAHDRFLIVLTSGTIAWGDGDFDWQRTDALPKRLAGWFPAEPKWVDLSSAHEDPQFSLRHSVFRKAIAELASPIHGKPVDDIEGEDIRQHRRTTSIRRFAVVFLALSLAVVTGLLGYTAVLRSDAEKQRDAALSRELAARSEATGDGDPDLARLLAVAAYDISPTAEARAAQFTAAVRPGAAVLSPGGGPVGALAFSPDGRTLVVGSADKTMSVWDSATHARIGAPVTGHRTPLASIAFSPDGATLATGDGGDVRLWRMADRRPVDPAGLIDSKLTKDNRSPDSNAYRVAFSPDGRWLVATAWGPPEMQMWDVATRAPIDPLARMYVSGRPAVAFGPDDDHVITLSQEGDNLAFWHTGSGPDGPFVAAHGDSFISNTGPAIAIAPNRQTIATVGRDNALRFWDASTKQPLGEPIVGYVSPDSATRIPAVAYSPDGALFVAGGHGGMVHLWDTAGRRYVGEPLRGHTGAVTTLAFSPNGELLATGSADGTVRLWSMSHHRVHAAPLAGHGGRVHAAAFSPDGRTLATAGDSRRESSAASEVYLCSDGGREVCFLDDDGVTAIAPGGSAWGPTNERAWSAEGPAVLLWDVVRRERTGDLAVGWSTAVRSVVFNADGSTLAVGGLEEKPDSNSQQDVRGILSLWRVDTRALQTTTLLDMHQTVRSLARHQDGRTFAVATDYRAGAGGSVMQVEPTVLLWDSKDRVPAGERLRGHTAYSTALSPDGQLQLAGLQDGRVQIWRHGHDTKQLPGHGGPVGAVAFAPDGKTWASASDDGTIRLWDTSTGTQIGEPLIGHTGPVYTVAFSPNGELLATGGGDDSVRLWHLPTRRQISPAHLAHHGAVRAVAFSPDGRSLATVGDDSGVRLWDVSPTTDPRHALCAMTNRTLSPEEWARYAPGVSYRAPCR
ncbi:TIR domain-containing protein [Kibdelosporangium philippinense]|uniref:TIR domain-containing protein n=1 Tax=Kibdelosporangium philippinense TaxID=211113 RepID=A0ABS8ZCU6_9PSEU|nr:TIR domain-containing protein [Kibdelosporangium philippinense]MCE7003657.1 TIR domain-containing protein [Kibdelosporangium philippinense]